MTCQQCEALAAEVARLERELGQRSDETALVAIRTGLGVSPSVARLIYCLFTAHRKMAPTWLLQEVLGRGEPVTVQHVHVRISNARGVLGARDAIRPVGLGYYALSAAARATVAEVIDNVENLTLPDLPKGRRGRFTIDEIHTIRGLEMIEADIASIFGVSTVMIHKIRSGESYAWVPFTPDEELARLPLARRRRLDQRQQRGCDCA